VDPPSGQTLFGWGAYSLAHCDPHHTHILLLFYMDPTSVASALWLAKASLTDPPVPRRANHCHLTDGKTEVQRG